MQSIRVQVPQTLLLEALIALADVGGHDALIAQICEYLPEVMLARVWDASA